jgi:hypothetical protein
MEGLDTLCGVGPSDSFIQVASPFKTFSGALSGQPRKPASDAHERMRCTGIMAFS